MSSNWQNLAVLDVESGIELDNEPLAVEANDTQHNDTQDNDTEHNGLICDTQHKWLLA